MGYFYGLVGDSKRYRPNTYTSLLKDLQRKHKVFLPSIRDFAVGVDQFSDPGIDQKASTA
jgi:hypothetical protein